MREGGPRKRRQGVCRQGQRCQKKPGTRGRAGRTEDAASAQGGGKHRGGEDLDNDEREASDHQREEIRDRIRTPPEVGRRIREVHGQKDGNPDRDTPGETGFRLRMGPGLRHMHPRGAGDLVRCGSRGTRSLYKGDAVSAGSVARCTGSHRARIARHKRQSWRATPTRAPFPPCGDGGRWRQRSVQVEPGTATCVDPVDPDPGHQVVLCLTSMVSCGDRAVRRVGGRPTGQAGPGVAPDRPSGVGDDLVQRLVDPELSSARQGYGRQSAPPLFLDRSAVDAAADRCSTSASTSSHMRYSSWTSFFSDG